MKNNTSPRAATISPTTAPNTLRIKSGVKSGGLKQNHNQTCTLRIRSGVKAHANLANHNQARA